MMQFFFNPRKWEKYKRDWFTDGDLVIGSVRLKSNYRAQVLGQGRIMGKI